MIWVSEALTVRPDPANASRLLSWHDRVTVTWPPIQVPLSPARQVIATDGAPAHGLGRFDRETAARAAARPAVGSPAIDAARAADCAVLSMSWLLEVSLPSHARNPHAARANTRSSIISGPADWPESLRQRSFTLPPPLVRWRGLTHALSRAARTAGCPRRRPPRSGSPVNS